MITWDESKRKLNLQKHGIDFRDADAIFDAPTVTAEDMHSRMANNVWSPWAY